MRRKTSQERVIGSLKDPKAGIKDHLYFLRNLKRDLKKRGTSMRKFKKNTPTTQRDVKNGNKNKN